MRKLLRCTVLLTGLLGGATAGWGGDPSTPITFQGQLLLGGQAAEGTFDLQMTLFDVALGGIATRAPIYADDTAVSRGLFTVELAMSLVDCTSGLRWVEIAVRPGSVDNGNRDPATYTVLSPRQKITYSLYAVYSRETQRFGGQQPTYYMPAATDNWVNVTGDSMTGSLVVSGAFNGTQAVRAINTGSGSSTAAVYGETTEPSSRTVGGHFVSRGDAGDGVYAVAASSSGQNRAVYGEIKSSQGFAAYFAGPAGSRNYLQRSVGIGVEAPRGMLDVLSLNNWSWSEGNGYGDVTVGSGSNALCIGVATDGGGVGIARLWPKTNHLILGSELGGDTLVVTAHAANSGRVGVKRTPATNALEVEGAASKTIAGSWLANSDARIKTDVQTIANALETLDRVRLVDFEYAEWYRLQHPGIEDRRYMNVVAQEFAQVFPHDVRDSGEKLAGGDGILQVDTHPLTIYSAAAIQELHARVKQEGAEIAALRAEKDAQIAELREANRRLEARLARLEALSREGCSAPAPATRSSR